jgi:hypothetical protein
MSVIGRSTPATILAIAAWGAGFTALPICLQSAVLRVAPRIPDTASALYVVAFQIGIGGGALIGAALLSTGSLAMIPTVGLALIATGSVIAVASGTTFARDPSHPLRLPTRRDRGEREHRAAPYHVQRAGVSRRRPRGGPGPRPAESRRETTRL